jgi:pyruvate,water dikinase
MTRHGTIQWFADPDASARAITGGKGANLGALAQADFPVPPGVVVTTAGYRRFVAANGLQDEVITLAAQPTAGDPAAYEAVSAQIRGLFLAGAIPGDLAEAIGAAYAELVRRSPDDTAVAVRSSATAEDLPDASFAGQQDTYLNVHGNDALLAAVQRCWASLWTARAMAYRERQHIPHDAVAMAVVVQMMVPAEVAGILFTANPSTGARDELVINASFGLGEAIVAGTVTPDTYVLDRSSLTLKETRLGTKDVMIVAAPPGLDGTTTTTQPVPHAWRGEAALSDALLGELAALGMRVEAQFDGVPQDIEWAVAKGHCWLLQARPITNVPPAPLQNVHWEPPRPGTVWMRRQVVEHMPEPLSPLFEELYLQEGLDQSVAAYTALMSDLTGVKFDLWSFIQPPFATTINGYAYSIASFNFRWSSVPMILRIYTAAMPKLLNRMLPHWRDEALPAYLATIERWKRIDLTDVSDEDVLQGIRALAIADAIYWFAAALPLGVARVTDAALDRFLKSIAHRRDGANGSRPTSGPYLRGFSSKTVEAQAHLEAIARDIHESEALRGLVVTTPARELREVLAQHPDGQAVLDALQWYLHTYGHQIYNLDFVAPTQADDPLPVLLSLQAAVAHPERDARTHQAELAQERDALVAGTAQTLNPLQRRLFRRLLSWAQRFTPYREEALFYVGAAWPTLRRLALELGRRLTDAGSLTTPDDVFFLKTTELTAASVSRAEGVSRPGLAYLAHARRELREARKRLEPPITVPPSGRLMFGPFALTMFEPQPRSAGDGPTLTGFAVSPGQVTAPTSVIRSPADFDQMAPDTILVCPTTTPAWTPLFSQAKGLVTDIGGALAHGSIVAREYGIPAVMGTGTATNRIVSGQRLHVDGDTGTVTLLDEADAVTGAGEPAQMKAKQAASGVSKTVRITLAIGVMVGLAGWWKARQRHMDK